MAPIGYGYGSEWHLLHYLGRRRAALSRLVERVTGTSHLEWLDYQEHAGPGTGVLKVREPKGLEFLSPLDPVRQEWEALWPQTGNVHNWDAVARAGEGAQTTWALVEAKAHTGELSSSCTAKDDEPKGHDLTRKRESGRKRIRAVLDSTRRDLGVSTPGKWERDYYQYANRLALLHFLDRREVNAHLVFLYFTGDRTDLGAPGRDCPRDESAWTQALTAQDRHVGLPAEAAIRRRVHRLFLPVYRVQIAEGCPRNQGAPRP